MSDRNQRSVESRIQQILPAISKLKGCVQQVEYTNPSRFSEQDIADVMQGKTLTSTYDASLINTLTGEDTEKNTTVDNSEKITANLKKIINFYQQILTPASQRGWSC